jgi:hypothetical protein
MMSITLRRILPILLVSGALSAHAQYLKSHKANISVGIDGQFSETLNAEPENSPAAAPLPVSGTYSVIVGNKQQYTTTSAGFLGSMQFHPVAWAGVELNYGFTHYQERYAFNYVNTSTPTAPEQVRISTDVHEATAAYLFHPKRIPFQPFMGVGGGALDFSPIGITNQWRAAGLLEAGFDIPVPSTHIGFRVEGRSLYYRSPNFRSSAISTISWRVTAQPVVSAFYRF